MKLQLNTAPANPAVSSNLLKTHLGIEQDYTQDDHYINMLILAAAEWLEGLTNRKFITQTWDLYLQEWPTGDDKILVPFGGLQGVNSVSYRKAGDSNFTTWSSDNYLISDGDYGAIFPDYGLSWPSDVLVEMYPIKVEFICGYGNTPQSIPNMLQLLIMKVAASAYINREVTITGSIMSIDKQFEEQVSPFKLWVV